MTELSFGEKYNLRTKRFAVQAILFYVNHCKKTEELRIIGRQFQSLYKGTFRSREIF